MPRKIKWGIIGTGYIASKFAKATVCCDQSQLVAIGSREQCKADKFGDEFNVPHCYSSYEQLVTDADIDAVYISTPHTFHKDNCVLALQAGKAVLCEKPFTINAAQAREVIDLARKKNLFLMEAMYSRFLPPIKKLREMVESGLIGQPRILQVQLGKEFKHKDSWHYDKNMAGGALMDLGVYCASLASMIFGQPKSVASVGHICEAGVDEQSTTVLVYGPNQNAVLITSFATDTPCEAILIGETGWIRLGPGWTKGSPLTLEGTSCQQEVFDVPCEENGFVYQLAEVAACLAAGKTESEIMPLDETLGVLETLDEIRNQWGYKFPGE